jgi:hypothetical protein
MPTDGSSRRSSIGLPMSARDPRPAPAVPRPKRWGLLDGELRRLNSTSFNSRLTCCARRYTNQTVPTGPDDLRPVLCAQSSGGISMCSALVIARANRQQATRVRLRPAIRRHSDASTIHNPETGKV